MATELFTLLLRVANIVNVSNFEKDITKSKAYYG